MRLDINAHEGELFGATLAWLSLTNLVDLRLSDLGDEDTLCIERTLGLVGQKLRILHLFPLLIGDDYNDDDDYDVDLWVDLPTLCPPRQTRASSTTKRPLGTDALPANFNPGVVR